MEINGKEYHIDELLQELEISKDFLKRRENGLLLNDRQIEILKHNQIDYLSCSNLSSLLFKIGEYLNESSDVEDPELEQIYQELEEIHYYEETHK